jgi:hypothetical protein
LLKIIVVKKLLLNEVIFVGQKEEYLRRLAATKIKNAVMRRLPHIILN